MMNKSFGFVGFIFAAVMLICMLIPIPSAEAGADFIISGKIMAGNIYLKSGDFAGALREFESVYKDNPKNPDVLIGLVRCHAYMGNFEKAWDMLTEFENKRSSDMRVHLVKAEILQLTGHFEEASHEFIILIEKGIYRFEAIQGIIRLYSENNDPSLKKIIDNTIALYEPVNQRALYHLLANNLEKSGRIDEAREYSIKLRFLDELDSNKGCEAVYSDVDPLDYVVNKASELLSRGCKTDAQHLLEEASLRWVGDYRIQELLKQCYMDIAQETPVIADKSDDAASAVGAGNLVVKSGLNTSSIMTYMPSDLPFNNEGKTYIDSIVSITVKTDNYYSQMIKNMLSLQKRVMKELEKPGPDYCTNMQRNLAELNVLLSESLKVSKEETVVLKKMSVPKGFEEFHTIILDIADIRTKMFEDVDMFISTRQMSYMEKAVEDMKKGDELFDKLTPAIIKAYNYQSPTPSSESAKEKSGTAVQKPAA